MKANAHALVPIANRLKCSSTAASARPCLRVAAGNGCEARPLGLELLKCCEAANR